MKDKDTKLLEEAYQKLNEKMNSPSFQKQYPKATEWLKQPYMERQSIFNLLHAARMVEEAGDSATAQQFYSSLAKIIDQAKKQGWFEPMGMPGS